MDFSPPGSSVHGILQARTLEWVTISFSKASSQPRNQSQVSHIADRLFTVWATREAPMGTKDVIKSRSRTPAPDNWDAYEWNGFSEPRCLHLPIHRRTLNALRYLVFLNQQSSLTFRLPARCCKLLYNLTPSPSSLEQFARGHLRRCLQGLKS